MNKNLASKTIREIRRSKNLTLKDVADSCGLSVSYVCGVEKNKTNNRGPGYDKILHFLGIEKPILNDINSTVYLDLCAKFGVLTTEQWLSIGKIIGTSKVVDKEYREKYLKNLEAVEDNRREPHNTPVVGDIWMSRESDYLQVKITAVTERLCGTIVRYQIHTRNNYISATTSLPWFLMKYERVTNDYTRSI